MAFSAQDLQLHRNNDQYLRCHHAPSFASARYAYAELASELYRNDDVLPSSTAYGSTPPTSLAESADGLSHSALGKRKRSLSPPDHEHKVIVNEPDLPLSTATEKAHAASKLISIRPPHLVYPKSMYHGHEPPLPVAKERLVLKQILVSFDPSYHAWVTYATVGRGATGRRI
ncbi:MAG: hypothetical protein Q9174_000552 [Haloplaca sp. 1 TL-2023]